MIYLLLIIVLLNLYFSIKRFDMLYVTTLNTMCVYIVLDCLALLAVIYATFIEFISGEDMALLIVCILVSLLTIVFDALTINKYVKIKTSRKDDD